MAGRGTIKYFSPKERDNFFKTLEDATKKAKTPFAKKIAIRNEAMFKIIYYCALRASESKIKKDSFNDSRNELYCERVKGGKNNTLRIIDKDILKSLKKHIAYNKPTEYLFVNFHTNSSLSRKTIWNLFVEVCEKNEIASKDKLHPHTLRHTRAIDLAEMELDLKDLQYWLGHKHVSNTLIYFDFTTRQHEAMYTKITKNQKKERKKNEQSNNDRTINT